MKNIIRQERKIKCELINNGKVCNKKATCVYCGKGYINFRDYNIKVKKLLKTI